MIIVNCNGGGDRGEWREARIRSPSPHCVILSKLLNLFKTGCLFIFMQKKDKARSMIIDA